MGQQAHAGVLLGNAGQVAGGIRRSATKSGVAEGDRKPVENCDRYLLKNTWCDTA